jgi:acetolactate synthase-1/2/3 large subunit
MPVVTSFNGFDLLESENDLFIGRIGTIGNRAANYALQNADLLISIGSRNNIRQISYNWNSYARNAKKICVDVDENELKKPTVKPDIAIKADSKEFLKHFKDEIKKHEMPKWNWWLEWCRERKMKYPVVSIEENVTKKKLDPYYFMSVLSACLKDTAVVITGNGTARP